MKLKDITDKIPEFVFNAVDILAEAGFEAYLVGGAVRDLMLGIEPKDYDIATNATPEQISKVFPHSVTTNARFGTILVIMSNREGERFDIEVTTYRKEEDYFGGRWPSKVEFTTNIEVDLSRRDFTINAMALDLKNVFNDGVSLSEVLMDPFDGIGDLQKQMIRAVGNPLERFSEDGLRAFKACRLASELEFLIEENTFEAIKNSLVVARKISMERIRDEFDKMLKHSSRPSVGIELMRESGLLEIFMPELLECIGVEQPQWHSEDVYSHSLRSLDLAEDSIKLAALLHDIGKSRTKTEDKDGVHFYGHDKVGAEMAKEILTRMKYSKSTINKVYILIRWHMFYYPSADWRKQNKLDEIEESGAKNLGGWTDSAIRRFISNVGEEFIDDLFKLRVADANANPKSEFNPVEIRSLESRISDVRSKDMALKITDLDVNGNELEKEGIEKGPKMGKILTDLLDLVIEDPNLNSKTKLIQLAKEIYSKL